MDGHHMSETLESVIRKWVVNDYFTPNIKAEVILDTLLTPYVPQLLRNECEIDAVFLTKEMSLEQFLPDGTGPEKKNDRGPKIDYVLTGRYAYLVELKTTDGSIESDQAKRYLECCCAPAGRPRTFASVFGMKLLRILGKQYSPDCPWELETLPKMFSGIAGDGKEDDHAERAMRYLRQSGRASTGKYLYTAGQILDRCPDAASLRALWGKELRLLYITPHGTKPHDLLIQCGDPEGEKFYIHPKGTGKYDQSISLMKAVPELSPREGGNDYLQMLKSIVQGICKEEDHA